MIKQILLGLLLGIIVTLTQLQYDPYVQKVIGDGFKMAFEQALDCKLNCTIEYINLLSPTIALRDVMVTPSESGHGWQWQAKKYVTQFSWAHLILKGAIDIRVHMQEVIAETDLENGSLAMLPHMEKMAIGDPNVPMLVIAINLENATFIVNDRAKKQRMSLSWKSNTQRMGQLVCSNVTILNGEFEQAKIPYIRNLTGEISCDVLETTGAPEFSIKSTCNVTIDNIFKQPLICSCNVQWDEIKKACSLSTSDHEIAIDKIKLSTLNQNFGAEIEGKFPLALSADIARLFGYQIPGIKGNADFNTQIIFDAPIPCVKGKIQINEIQIDSHMIAHTLSCDFCHEDNQFSGKISAKNDMIGSIAADWAYDIIKKNGSCNIHNDTSLIIPIAKDWCIKADDCMLAVKSDAQGALSGIYRLSATNNEKSHSLAGEIKTDFHQIQLNGMIDDKKYFAQLHLAPHVRLNEFTVIDEDKTALASFTADHASANGVSGEIDLEKLKSFFLPADFQIGTLGKLFCKANLLNTIFHIECALRDAAVRIPDTYNCITKLETIADFDIAAKKMMLSKIDVQVQNGSISCENGVIALTENNQIANVYLPFIFNNCFIPIQKDIHLTASGNMIARYQKDGLPDIKGHLFIDNAVIKPNILSIDFIKMIMALALQNASKSIQLPLDATCDITLDTKDPIHIATHVIETDAHVSLHVYNSIKNPLLSGSINLLNGIVYLPYKPLFINKGLITFAPGHLENPHIEFVAQNTIKKHDISLHASGTLKDYAFWMSSNPALNENEIASLLLVGSPNASVGSIVPAVATQTLKNIIFESSPFLTASNDTVKKIIKPLRTVHLVPVFDNQTARGGIRGAFEIEIGDRVKALIQKNFTLTEDTRFELEYLLSDDVSIRGIRDERRDVNAELEMRWKF